MPRNKSEKYPLIPELHAYVEACEQWLANPTLTFAWSRLWSHLSMFDKDNIRYNCGNPDDQSDDRREWRAKIVAYVRRNYAAK